jgi:hypothetical protein
MCQKSALTESQRQSLQNVIQKLNIRTILQDFVSNEKNLNFVDLWVCDFSCVTIGITTKCKRPKNEALQLDQ